MLLSCESITRGSIADKQLVHLMADAYKYANAVC